MWPTPWILTQVAWALEHIRYQHTFVVRISSHTQCSQHVIFIRPGHETRRFETLWYLFLAHLIPLLYRLALADKGKSLETASEMTRRLETRARSRLVPWPNLYMRLWPWLNTMYNGFAALKLPKLSLLTAKLTSKVTPCHIYSYNNKQLQLYTSSRSHL